MPLTTDLISYWSLSDANDAHGSNHLTNNNSVPFVAGKVGNAADFEASSSHSLTRADNAGLSTGDIDFTIACWVNLESTGGNRSIFQKADSNGLEYDLMTNGGTFQFRVSSGTGFANLTLVAGPNNGATTSTWFFLVAEHDSVNDLIKLSIDGGAFTTAAYSSGSYDSGAPVNLGGYVAFGEYTDGLVDEAAFWKRCLSDAEVDELYNAGAGRDYAYVSGGGGGANIPAIMASYRRRRTG